MVIMVVANQDKIDSGQRIQVAAGRGSPFWTKKELDGGSSVAKNRVGEDAEILQLDVISGVADPCGGTCARIFPEVFVSTHDREAVHFGSVSGNKGIRFHGIADRGDGSVGISEMSVWKVV